LTFKPFFSLSLNADPDRLHFAAHSHHLWPDASFEGQQQCWRDAAELADSKWDKIMGEVWPEAQGHVARELGTAAPECIVFAPNTHALLVSLAAAAPRAGKLRILTSGGEFHSARRQFARWAEAGEIALTEVAPEPFDTLAKRFLWAARAGDHDLIFISQLLFGSGRLFTAVEELAALGRQDGPWVVIDGYHAFMAVPQPFGATAAASAFYLGGGYKYAMAGEGCAFMHAPSGFGARPPITGWYAEFEDLALPPGMVGYAPDAARFLGGTFDPSGLYRFNAVQRMLIEHGIDTRRARAHVAALQGQFLAGIIGCLLDQAALLNPPGQSAQARFLAFRDARSPDWSQQLKRRNCVTDVRGDVLRIGFGLYHDEQDVTRLIEMVRTLT
jgi:selenocysteine lyase/cysteine desulfurase